MEESKTSVIEIPEKAVAENQGTNIEAENTCFQGTDEKPTNALDENEDFIVTLNTSVRENVNGYLAPVVLNSGTEILNDTSKEEDVNLEHEAELKISGDISSNFIAPKVNDENVDTCKVKNSHQTDIHNKPDMSKDKDEIIEEIVIERTYKAGNIVEIIHGKHDPAENGNTEERPKYESVSDKNFESRVLSSDNEIVCSDDTCKIAEIEHTKDNSQTVSREDVEKKKSGEGTVRNTNDTCNEGEAGYITIKNGGKAEGTLETDDLSDIISKGEMAEHADDKLETRNELSNISAGTNGLGHENNKDIFHGDNKFQNTISNKISAPGKTGPEPNKELTLRTDFDHFTPEDNCGCGNEEPTRVFQDDHNAQNDQPESFCRDEHDGNNARTKFDITSDYVYFGDNDKSAVNEVNRHIYRTKIESDKHKSPNEYGEKTELFEMRDTKHSVEISNIVADLKTLIVQKYSGDNTTFNVSEYRHDNIDNLSETVNECENTLIGLDKIELPEEILFMRPEEENTQLSKLTDSTNKFEMGQLWGNLVSVYTQKTETLQYRDGTNVNSTEFADENVAEDKDDNLSSANIYLDKAERTSQQQHVPRDTHIDIQVNVLTDASDLVKIGGPTSDKSTDNSTNVVLDPNNDGGLRERHVRDRHGKSPIRKLDIPDIEYCRKDYLECHSPEDGDLKRDVCDGSKQILVCLQRMDSNSGEKSESNGQNNTKNESYSNGDDKTICTAVDGNEENQLREIQLSHMQIRHNNVLSENELSTNFDNSCNRSNNTHTFSSQTALNVRLEYFDMQTIQQRDVSKSNFSKGQSDTSSYNEVPVPRQLHNEAEKYIANASPEACYPEPAVKWAALTSKSPHEDLFQGTLQDNSKKHQSEIVLTGNTNLIDTNCEDLMENVSNIKSESLPASKNDQKEENQISTASAEVERDNNDELAVLDRAGEKYVCSDNDSVRSKCKSGLLLEVHNSTVPRTFNSDIEIDYTQNSAILNMTLHPDLKSVENISNFISVEMKVQQDETDSGGDTKQMSLNSTSIDSLSSDNDHIRSLNDGTNQKVVKVDHKLEQDKQNKRKKSGKVETKQKLKKGKERDDKDEHPDIMCFDSSYDGSVTKKIEEELKSESQLLDLPDYHDERNNNLSPNTDSKEFQIEQKVRMINSKTLEYTDDVSKAKELEEEVVHSNGNAYILTDKEPLKLGEDTEIGNDIVDHEIHISNQTFVSDINCAKSKTEEDVDKSMEKVEREDGRKYFKQKKENICLVVNGTRDEDNVKECAADRSIQIYDAAHKTPFNYEMQDFGQHGVSKAVDTHNVVTCLTENTQVIDVISYKDNDAVDLKSGQEEQIKTVCENALISRMEKTDVIDKTGQPIDDQLKFRVKTSELSDASVEEINANLATLEILGIANNNAHNKTFVEQSIVENYGKEIITVVKEERFSKLCETNVMQHVKEEGNRSTTECHQVNLVDIPTNVSSEAIEVSKVREPLQKAQNESDAPSEPRTVSKILEANDNTITEGPQNKISRHTDTDDYLLENKVKVKEAEQQGISVDESFSEKQTITYQENTFVTTDVKHENNGIAVTKFKGITVSAIDENGESHLQLLREHQDFQNINAYTYDQQTGIHDSKQSLKATTHDVISNAEKVIAKHDHKAITNGGTKEIQLSIYDDKNKSNMIPNKIKMDIQGSISNDKRATKNSFVDEVFVNLSEQDVSNIDKGTKKETEISEKHVDNESGIQNTKDDDSQSLNISASEQRIWKQDIGSNTMAIKEAIQPNSEDIVNMDLTLVYDNLDKINISVNRDNNTNQVELKSRDTSQHVYENKADQQPCKQNSTIIDEANKRVTNLEAIHLDSLTIDHTKTTNGTITQIPLYLEDDEDESKVQYQKQEYQKAEQTRCELKSVAQGKSMAYEEQEHKFSPEIDGINDLEKGNKMFAEESKDEIPISAEGDIDKILNQFRMNDDSINMYETVGERGLGIEDKTLFFISAIKYKYPDTENITSEHGYTPFTDGITKVIQLSEKVEIDDDIQFPEYYTHKGIEEALTVLQPFIDDTAFIFQTIDEAVSPRVNNTDGLRQDNSNVTDNIMNGTYLLAQDVNDATADVDSLNLNKHTDEQQFTDYVCAQNVESTKQDASNVVEPIDSLPQQALAITDGEINSVHILVKNEMDERKMLHVVQDDNENINKDMSTMPIGRQDGVSNIDIIKQISSSEFANMNGLEKKDTIMLDDCSNKVDFSVQIGTSINLIQSTLEFDVNKTKDQIQIEINDSTSTFQAVKQTNSLEAEKIHNVANEVTNISDPTAMTCHLYVTNDNYESTIQHTTNTVSHSNDINKDVLQIRMEDRASAWEGSKQDFAPESEKSKHSDKVDTTVVKGIVKEIKASTKNYSKNSCIQCMLLDEFQTQDELQLCTNKSIYSIKSTSPYASPEIKTCTTSEDDDRGMINISTDEIHFLSPTDSKQNCLYVAQDEYTSTDKITLDVELNTKGISSKVEEANQDYTPEVNNTVCVKTNSSQLIQEVGEEIQLSKNDNRETFTHIKTQDDSENMHETADNATKHVFPVTPANIDPSEQDEVTQTDELPRESHQSVFDNNDESKTQSMAMNDFKSIDIATDELHLGIQKGPNNLETTKKYIATKEENNTLVQSNASIIDRNRTEMWILGTDNCDENGTRLVIEHNFQTIDKDEVQLDVRGIANTFKETKHDVYPEATLEANVSNFNQVAPLRLKAGAERVIKTEVDISFDKIDCAKILQSLIHGQDVKKDHEGTSGENSLEKSLLLSHNDTYSSVDIQVENQKDLSKIGHYMKGLESNASEAHENELESDIDKKEIISTTRETVCNFDETQALNSNPNEETDNLHKTAREDFSKHTSDDLNKTHLDTKELTVNGEIVSAKLGVNDYDETKQSGHSLNEVNINDEKLTLPSNSTNKNSNYGDSTATGDPGLITISINSIVTDYLKASDEIIKVSKTKFERLNKDEHEAEEVRDSTQDKNYDIENLDERNKNKSDEVSKESANQVNISYTLYSDTGGKIIPQNSAKVFDGMTKEEHEHFDVSKNPVWDDLQTQAETENLSYRVKKKSIVTENPDNREEIKYAVVTVEQCSTKRVQDNWTLVQPETMGTNKSMEKENYEEIDDARNIGDTKDENAIRNGKIKLCSYHDLQTNVPNDQEGDRKEEDNTKHAESDTANQSPNTAAADVTTTNHESFIKSINHNENIRENGNEKEKPSHSVQKDSFVEEDQYVNITKMSDPSTFEDNTGQASGILQVYTVTSDDEIGASSRTTIDQKTVNCSGNLTKATEELDSPDEQIQVKYTVAKRKEESTTDENKSAANEETNTEQSLHEVSYPLQACYEMFHEATYERKCGSQNCGIDPTITEPMVQKISADKAQCDRVAAKDLCMTSEHGIDVPYVTKQFSQVTHDKDYSNSSTRDDTNTHSAISDEFYLTEEDEMIADISEETPVKIEITANTEETTNLYVPTNVPHKEKVSYETTHNKRFTKYVGEGNHEAETQETVQVDVEINSKDKDEKTISDKEIHQNDLYLRRTREAINEAAYITISENNIDGTPNDRLLKDGSYKVHNDPTFKQYGNVDEPCVSNNLRIYGSQSAHNVGIENTLPESNKQDGNDDVPFAIVDKELLSNTEKPIQNNSIDYDGSSQSKSKHSVNNTCQSATPQEETKSLNSPRCADLESEEISDPRVNVSLYVNGDLLYKILHEDDIERRPTTQIILDTTKLMKEEQSTESKTKEANTESAEYVSLMTNGGHGTRDNRILGDRRVRDTNVLSQDQLISVTTCNDHNGECEHIFIPLERSTLSEHPHIASESESIVHNMITNVSEMTSKPNMNLHVPRVEEYETVETKEAKYFPYLSAVSRIVDSSSPGIRTNDSLKDLIFKTSNEIKYESVHSSPENTGTDSQRNVGVHTLLVERTDNIASDESLATNEVIQSKYQTSKRYNQTPNEVDDECETQTKEYKSDLIIEGDVHISEEGFYKCSIDSNNSINENEIKKNETHFRRTQSNVSEKARKMCEMECHIQQLSEDIDKDRTLTDYIGIKMMDGEDQFVAATFSKPRSKVQGNQNQQILEKIENIDSEDPRRNQKAKDVNEETNDVKRMLLNDDTDYRKTHQEDSEPDRKCIQPNEEPNNEQTQLNYVYHATEAGNIPEDSIVREKGNEYMREITLHPLVNDISDIPQDKDKYENDDKLEVSKDQSKKGILQNCASTSEEIPTSKIKNDTPSKSLPTKILSLVQDLKETLAEETEMQLQYMSCLKSVRENIKRGLEVVKSIKCDDERSSKEYDSESEYSRDTYVIYHEDDCSHDMSQHEYSIGFEKSQDNHNNDKFGLSRNLDITVDEKDNQTEVTTFGVSSDSEVLEIGRKMENNIPTRYKEESEKDVDKQIGMIETNEEEHVREKQEISDFISYRGEKENLNKTKPCENMSPDGTVLPSGNEGNVREKNIKTSLGSGMRKYTDAYMPKYHAPKPNSKVDSKWPSDHPAYQMLYRKQLSPRKLNIGALPHLKKKNINDKGQPPSPIKAVDPIHRCGAAFLPPIHHPTHPDTTDDIPKGKQYLEYLHNHPILSMSEKTKGNFGNRQKENISMSLPNLSEKLSQSHPQIHQELMFDPHPPTLPKKPFSAKGLAELEEYLELTQRKSNFPGIQSTSKQPDMSHTSSIEDLVEIIQVRKTFYLGNMEEKDEYRERRIHQIFRELQEIRKKTEEGKGILIIRKGVRSRSDQKDSENSKFIHLDYSHGEVDKMKTDEDLRKFLCEPLENEMGARKPLFQNKKRQRAYSELKDKLNQKYSRKYDRFY